MTPLQKIKYLILAQAALWDKTPAPEYPCTNVDELYKQAEDLWDAIGEVRYGEARTHLPCPYSRHYEAESVAMQMPDGSWVGWTYWFGGGKHGEPSAMPWMEDAYDLVCEERMEVVRHFTLVPG